eukprot:CAMPEP_0174277744 /NCGR_PEP_ID=MMETSP0439-20130205/61097_1 /TAXON_ID=0 /ORGANISM="Stereomyxa ramosa, Strain Chinc5" /LENGTH=243 /DNA_ID=CAMNT_0015370087 /DNA_START=538 /DNA_END=1266 /DNA_ORIENTATION=+
MIQKQKEMKRKHDEWKLSQMSGEEKEKFQQQLQLNELKRKEIEQRTYECPICFCDYSSEEICVLAKCGDSYCRDCLSYHIKIQTEENIIQTQINKSMSCNNNVMSVTEDVIYGISCPEPTCKEIIEIHEIKQIVSSDIFEFFDNRLRDKALQGVKGVIWCRTPDCQNALFRQRETPMLICYVCRGSWCIDCDVTWHADKTCVEFQSADMEAEQWVDANCQRCPKCGAPIEKNGGCNHMTCRNC